MSSFEIRYSAAVPDGAEVLIPGGVHTPYGRVTEHGGRPGKLRALGETSTGQIAGVLCPETEHAEIIFRFDTTAKGKYPETIFYPRDTRFTRYAEDLAAEARDVALGFTGIERAQEIARHTAERFTYGHPETRFNDGMEEVPALGCGMAEGSCVDINTYFIAALRAAGIEAGYITGFFFPAEKDGSCTDGHCWVVTRIGGETQEWDIAHHLKLGTRDIRPGLNPKPGQRFACFHSMGLDFPDLGVTGLKALIEPVAVLNGDVIPFERPQIRVVDRARLAT